MFFKFLLVIAFKTAVSEDQNVLKGSKELLKNFQEDFHLFSHGTSLSSDNNNNTKRWAPHVNIPKNLIPLSLSKPSQSFQGSWQQTFDTWPMYSATTFRGQAKTWPFSSFPAHPSIVDQLSNLSTAKSTGNKGEKGLPMNLLSTENGKVGIERPALASGLPNLNRPNQPQLTFNEQPFPAGNFTEDNPAPFRPQTKTQKPKEAPVIFPFSSVPHFNHITKTAKPKPLHQLYQLPQQEKPIESLQHQQLSFSSHHHQQQQQPLVSTQQKLEPDKLNSAKEERSSTNFTGEELLDAYKAFGNALEEFINQCDVIKEQKLLMENILVHFS